MSSPDFTKIALKPSGKKLDYAAWAAKVKAETGMNLTKYITNVKMRESAKLLLTTDKNIAEITRAVGYDNSNYFSKLFKKNYGVTPTEYRRSQNSDEI